MHAHLIAFLLLLVATPAAAQRAVTVIGPNADDVDAPTALATAAGMLSGASAASDTAVEDYTNVSLADVVQLVGCSEVELRCLEELAVTLDAEVLVFGELAGGTDGATFALSLYERGAAELPAPSVLALPASGVQEHVALRTRAFLEGQAVVTVTTDEPGELLADGRASGPAPTTVVVTPGTVELRVAFEDGRTSEVQAEVAAPSEYTFEVLAPTGRAARVARVESEPGTPRELRPARVVGWSALGLAAGAFGIAAYHGSQVSDAQERFDSTPYQSTAYAIADEGRQSARRSNVLIGVGVGLAAAGVIALVLDRPAEDESASAGAAWAVSPVSGGALGVVRWTR